MFTQDRDFLKKIREMADKEREEHLKTVKERANKPADSKFHPTGPQEYPDL
jgi:hypothetical protein